MKNKNRIAIVIDCSGSMGVIRKETIDLFNQTLAQLKDRFAPSTEATLVYFGVGFGGLGCEVIHRNVRLDKIEPLSDSQYGPHGWTPLYDGIATAISTIECSDSEMSYGVWVLTDGQENRSSGYYRLPHNIRKLINDKQATDAWTFAVMVHKNYVNQFRSLGAVPEGNIMAWGDIHEATMASVASVNNYSDTRAAGLRSTRAVFTTDLSGIGKRDLNSLRDVTHECKVWTVKKGIRIDHFTNEKTNGGFKPGTCFYQLQKRERLQADKKQFLIIEKGTKTVHVADRAFLGMPEGQVSLNPGNHANYDIFVLSSSNNRNLLAGSRLIFWPNASGVAVHLHGIPGAAP